MELWSKQHVMTLLPSIAVMLLLACILRKCLGKKSLSVRMIPFHVLTVCIVLLEIGKQIVSLTRGYDLYHLPFHFCSLFIFMMPIMSLYRGKGQETVRGITAALCSAVCLLMLIYPALIYNATDITGFFQDYLSFHTVCFHTIVVFAFILIVALELHAPKSRGMQKRITLYMVCFCAVSATMAQLLKTNFNNFYSCNVPPLETLRQNLQSQIGYVPTQVLYILIVTLLDVLFVLGAYWIYRAANQLVTRKIKVEK